VAPSHLLLLLNAMLAAVERGEGAELVVRSAETQDYVSIGLGRDDVVCGANRLREYTDPPGDP